MGWVVNATPRPLYPRKTDRVPIVGGPQGRSGRVLKSLDPPGFDPRTVQPLASRYTDWTIPVQEDKMHHCEFLTSPVELVDVIKQVTSYKRYLHSTERNSNLATPWMSAKLLASMFLGLRRSQYKTVVSVPAWKVILQIYGPTYTCALKRNLNVSVTYQW